MQILSSVEVLADDNFRIHIPHYVKWNLKYTHNLNNNMH
jgi:glutaredoxin-related protein